MVSVCPSVCPARQVYGVCKVDIDRHVALGTLKMPDMKMRDRVAGLENAIISCLAFTVARLLHWHHFSGEVTVSEETIADQIEQSVGVPVCSSGCLYFRTVPFATYFTLEVSSVVSCDI